MGGVRLCWFVFVLFGSWIVAVDGQMSRQIDGSDFFIFSWRLFFLFFFFFFFFFFFSSFARVVCCCRWFILAQKSILGEFLFFLFQMFLNFFFITIISISLSFSFLQIIFFSSFLSRRKEVRAHSCGKVQLVKMGKTHHIL